MSKMTDRTYRLLQSHDVDTSKLLASYASAHAKREVTRQNVSQSGKKFTLSEGSELKRATLLDHEDYALQVLAFDSHMDKAASRWDLAEWEIPAAMLNNCQIFWPYVKKTEKQEAAVK